jgi:hypothetical protein
MLLDRRGRLVEPGGEVPTWSATVQPGVVSAAVHGPVWQREDRLAEESVTDASSAQNAVFAAARFEAWGWGGSPNGSFWTCRARSESAHGSRTRRWSRSWPWKML